MERSAPVTAIVPLVSADISFMWRRILLFEELHVLPFFVLLLLVNFFFVRYIYCGGLTIGYCDLLIGGG